MDKDQEQIYLKKLSESKKRFRIKQAKLPFEEKIKAVIRMQKRRNEIGRARFKPFGEN